MESEGLGLVFGHSHVWSLKRAISSAKSRVLDDRWRVLLCGTQELSGDLVVFDKRQRAHLNPCIQAAVRGLNLDQDAREKSWLVSVVQGNYYNVVGLHAQVPAYDFVVPGYEHLPLNPDAQVVPYSAMRAMLERETADLGPFFEKLVGMGFGGVAHIDSPPPVRSNEFIHNDLASRSGDKPVAPIADPFVRLKVWLTQRDVVQSLCESTGVRHVSNPMGTTDDQGFIQPELAKDLAHATHEYSTLVLRDLQAEIWSSR